MAGYGDCRHVCDDEEHHHEDLDEGDNVHEDHDDHWSASGSEDCLVMFPLSHCKNALVFRVFFGLYGVAASSLIGLYDLVLVSVVTPVLWKKRHTSSFFHLLLCPILPCRIARVLLRACAFGTARPRRSAPRSFRNFASSRNLRNLLPF